MLRILVHTFLFIILNLPAVVAAQDPNTFDTIEILSPRFTKLHRQRPEECDRQDKSPYNLSYGREMIFKVHPSPTPDIWRGMVASHMRGFYEKMEQLGVGSNPILASLNFNLSSLGYQMRLTLPYLFFSGDRAKVIARLHVTQMEAEQAAKLLPAGVSNQVIIIMKDSSLEAIVYKCFPQVFTIPKFKDIYFVLRNNPSTSLEELKIPALYFRQFLYSHFIDPQEYEEFLSRSPLMPFKDIVTNLVGYSDGCAPEDSKDTKIFSAHELVLNLALQESFLRQVKHQMLLDAFDAKDINDLFGQGSHGIMKEETHPEENKGMSYCFHQSEQGLLRYLLDSDGDKKHHNEFTSYLVNFMKEFFAKKFDDYRKNLEFIQDSGGLLLSPPPTAVKLPSFEELGASSPAPSPSIAIASKLKEETGEIKVRLKENIVLDLDIISSRHICKYCRATLYFCRDKLLHMIKEQLFIRGININKQERTFGDLHKRVISHFNIVDHIPPNIRLYFSGNLELNILATAGVTIDPPLMGKMEIKK